MTNWYAVYTRPRCEKKVAEGFLKRTLESYCPLSTPVRSWTGLKASAIALFPSYVFVRLEPARLAEARRVDGVINLVYWLGAPVVIRDIEVEMIRRFLNVYKVVQVEKTGVSPTAMVQLAEGAAVRQDVNSGTAAPSATGARLLIPSLGYLLVAVSELHAHQPVHYTQLPRQYEPKPFAINLTQ